MGWFDDDAKPKGPSRLEVARLEVEMMSDMYQKMVDTCFSKCIVNMKEDSLSVGEMSCTDRCAFKYLSSQEAVGNRIKEIEAEMVQQSDKAKQMMGP
mmetsp:Transcript_11882/g.17718  ORF Transcript_11882/g.17718 Transcript_11882/m.17718 type:complete len:97 (-) Transcript_11882:109-399(-)|eukprot:CAMPEP_0171462568 /NCGR_PEP_ID=MMETSP0945-20130129/6553_1 /TAXON_ID=109269 /ORGANISM="Vaucheria litorea, Strain CCMP2940" /LENGTH=96 /DNA_ID=CAMNT_0011989119 /DNA_START=52 /DNA_END=342 /DNA_ORIENTATION=-